MNPNILGVIGPGFLSEVPTLGFGDYPELDVLVPTRKAEDEPRRNYG